MSDIEMLSPPASVSMADAWYQYASATHFWFQWRLWALRKLIAKTAIGDKILEIGCGNGIARQQLEGVFQRPVDGCDLNVSALGMAREGRGKLYCYDVYDQRPEWASYFDTVLLLDTLEHIDNTDRFLCAIRHHIKPGGNLIVNVPAIQALYGDYDRAAGHVKRYSIKVLRRELELAGFHVCRHRHWGFPLIPVVAMRKLIQRSGDVETIISRGFAPTSRAEDMCLRVLMWCERLIAVPPPMGSSLAAVATHDVGLCS